MKKISGFVIALMTAFSASALAHDCPAYLGSGSNLVESDLQSMQKLADDRKYSKDIHRQFVSLAKEVLEAQVREGVSSATFTDVALKVIEASRPVSGEINGRFVTTLTEVAPMVRKEASQIGLKANDIERLKRLLKLSYVPSQPGRRLYIEALTWDWGLTAEQREQEQKAYASVGLSPIHLTAKEMAAIESRISRAWSPAAMVRNILRDLAAQRVLGSDFVEVSLGIIERANGSLATLAPMMVQESKGVLLTTINQIRLTKALVAAGIDKKSLPDFGEPLEVLAQKEPRQ